MMLGGWTWTPNTNNSWEWGKKIQSRTQKNKVDLKEEQVEESKTLRYPAAPSTNASSNESKG